MGGPVRTDGCGSWLSTACRGGPGESIESQSHRHGRVRAADEQHRLGWRARQCPSPEQDDWVAEGLGRQRVTDHCDGSFTPHRAGGAHRAESARTIPPRHRCRSGPLTRPTSACSPARSGHHSRTLNSRVADYRIGGTAPPQDVRSVVRPAVDDFRSSSGLRAGARRSRTTCV